MALRALTAPAACLLLGAIATYAAAVIALNANTVGQERFVLDTPRSIGHACGDFRVGSESYVLFVSNNDSPLSNDTAQELLHWAESSHFRSQPTATCGTFLLTFEPVAIDTAGLPFRCVWCWQSSDTYTPSRPSAGTHAGAWSWPRKPSSKIPSTRDLAYLLPYRLRPAGFAANTAIFAGAFWLLALAPTSIRTSLRRHRNLCPRCAYDLRATPKASPCPECGHVC